jgi:hypothetical protein
MSKHAYYASKYKVTVSRFERQRIFDIRVVLFWLLCYALSFIWQVQSHPLNHGRRRRGIAHAQIQPKRDWNTSIIISGLCVIGPCKIF